MKILKKIIISFLLLLVFTFNATALSVDNLTPTDDLILYSENPSQVSEILKVDENSLAETIKENNIIFLAVNEKNSKQIQLIWDETAFSSSVGNLSNLSNDSINALLPDITGDDNIKGDIVYLENQKLVKINKTSDNFIITQFYTIKDNKIYILSFFTNSDESLDYIDKTLVTGDESNIDKAIDSAKLYRIVIICATVLFGGICFVIIFFILKDLFFTRAVDDTTAEELPETKDI